MKSHNSSCKITMYSDSLSCILQKVHSGDCQIQVQENIILRKTSCLIFCCGGSTFGNSGTTPFFEIRVTFFMEILTMNGHELIPRIGVA